MDWERGREGERERETKWREEMCVYRNDNRKKEKKEKKEKPKAKKAQRKRRRRRRIGTG